MAGTVLLLGGRSEIGLALTKRLVTAGHSTVVLAARQPDELEAETAALRAVGAVTVECVTFDADDIAGHGPLLTALAAAHHPLAVVIVAFGILGDQHLAERDADHALAVLHTDFTAQVSVLTHLAGLLRTAGSGQIVVFSSIAGARVRRANYVYGSAKAGLDGFASGLADALTGSGVHLLVVRPGFVVGRMTEAMTPAPFASTPDEVAAAAESGLRARKDVVWVPPVLRVVIVLMRLLPRAVWRRLPR